MGILLNSLKLGDKEFSIENSQGFIPRNTFVEDHFYGGRVHQFAKTAKEGIYLCIEKDKVIDVYIPDLKALEVRDLKFLAELKGIQYEPMAKKDQMLKVFGVI